jgi:hypothetical protein
MKLKFGCYAYDSTAPGDKDTVALTQCFLADSSLRATHIRRGSAAESEGAALFLFLLGANAIEQPVLDSTI